MGLLLTVPALVALLWSYVRPTALTILYSFQQASIIQGTTSFVGLDNYRLALQDDLLSGFGVQLLLGLVPLLLAVVVAPFVALAADRSGRIPRLLARVLLTLPIAAYAPVAVLLTWSLDHQKLDRWKLPVLTALGDVSLLSAPLVVAVAATVFLSAVRRRPAPNRNGLTLLAVGGTLGLAVLATNLQSYAYPALNPSIRGRTFLAGPAVQITSTLLNRFRQGPAAAAATLLGLTLGLFGLIAVGLLLATRTRIELDSRTPRGAVDQPGVPAAPSTSAAGDRNRPLALVGLVIALLAFVGVLVVAYLPWLSRYGVGIPHLPGSTILGKVLSDTWLPPLLSTLVGVLLAALAGYGIGVLRPLGRASNLLLLPFAPWLFVGTLPLLLVHFNAYGTPGRMSGLIDRTPPSWLSIPGLVVFTLLFDGLRARRERESGSRVLLPALPMVGLVALVTWLVAAQDLLWPWFTGQRTGPVLMIMTVRSGGGVATIDTIASWGSLALPLPMLLLFLLAFVALQLTYLDRIAIRSGRRTP